MKKCEHGLTTRECLVCASPKYGASPQPVPAENPPVAQSPESAGSDGAVASAATGAPKERQANNLRQSSASSTDAACVLASAPGTHPTPATDTRSCTCHPSERPAVCPKRYALLECWAASQPVPAEPVGERYVTLQERIEKIGPPWKQGNEYLPYHPNASHVPPEHRDGWNRCYLAALSAPATGEDAGAIAVLREVRDWDHRGDSVQEAYDERHGAGAYDAAIAAATPEGQKT